MKRKALLAALRVGSMQAVYAMQPESAAFRAQLQCFEPDESFLSEAMSGIWDDAERAVATRRASPEKAVTANLEEAACQAASEEGRGAPSGLCASEKPRRPQLQTAPPSPVRLPDQGTPCSAGLLIRRPSWRRTSSLHQGLRR